MLRNEYNNVRYTLIGVTHSRWVGGQFTVSRMTVAHKGYLHREAIAEMTFDAPEQGYGAKAVVDSVALIYSERLPEGSFITYAEWVKRWYGR